MLAPFLVDHRVAVEVGAGKGHVNVVVRLAAAPGNAVARRGTWHYADEGHALRRREQGEQDARRAEPTAGLGMKTLAAEGGHSQKHHNNDAQHHHR